MNRILTKNPQKALQCVLLKPCLNGGACAEDNKGGYICTCLKGFTGPTCNISNYKHCSHIYLCSNKNQFSKQKKSNFEDSGSGVDGATILMFGNLSLISGKIL